ncbi:MAG: ABC transporter ATP-binding protein [Candidatus Lokiarchaeota archaeon]|nr:ABC transporter ATP-binding protein [Candidatus Lokiarchaeota archaeon]
MIKDSIQKDGQIDSPEIKKGAIIQTIDLNKIYNITEGIEVRALSGVSMSVQKGEFVSVMGPSGSGKTTLLNMIGALDNPSSGSVYINGTNIAKMNDKERTNLRLKEIGFIFQFYNLVPVLTAFENAELPMVFAGKPKAQREASVNKFLKIVGLSEMKDHLPSELSGGEQQRVAIARALCNEPSILIADEPTGELDTKMGMEIIKLLRSLNAELNQTILMVTHDPAVGALADRILKMRDGRIIETVITKS